MKKLFIALLSALVMTCTFVLAACGGNAAFYNKKFNIEKFVQSDISEVKKLDLEYEDGMGITTSGNLALFRAGSDIDGYSYSVFNAESEKTVFELEVEADNALLVNVGFINNKYFFKTVVDEEENEFTVTVYDADGKEVVKGEANATDYVGSWLTDNYVLIGNEIYVITETSFEKIGKYTDAELLAYENLGEYYNGFFVREFEGVVSIYSKKNLELVVSYKIPNYVEDSLVNILANGNVLVQNIVLLDSEAEEYDFKMGGEKVALETLIINPAKKNIKAVKNVDYLVIDNEITTWDKKDVEGNFNAKNVENVATIFRIENREIDVFGMQANMEIVALSNNGKIIASAKVIEQQANGSIAEPIAKDRYLIETTDGASYLVNGKGKIILNVTGVREITVNNFSTDYAIYDFNGKKVLDLKEQGYTVELATASSLILSKEGEEDTFYVFSGDKIVAEITGEGVYDDDVLLQVEVEDGVYKIFNADGKEIDEVDFMVDETYTFDNGKVLIVPDEDGNFYLAK